MPEHAKTPVDGRGQGGACVGTDFSDSSTIPVPGTPTTYQTVRESCYEAVLDDALDELAGKAVRFSFLAGRFHEAGNTSDFHREYMRGMADAVAFRLQERCMAYEHLLRTTPVPERRGGRQ
jgi:hypothetical protein